MAGRQGCCANDDPCRGQDAATAAVPVDDDADIKAEAADRDEAVGVKFTRMANVESLRIMVLDFGLFRERDYYLVKILLLLFYGVSEFVCPASSYLGTPTT